MAIDIPFEQRLGSHLEVPGRGGGVWLSDTQARAVCELIAAARRALRQYDTRTWPVLTNAMAEDLRAALAALDRKDAS